MSVHIDVEEILQRLGALKSGLSQAVLVAVRAGVADAVRYTVLGELRGQVLTSGGLSARTGRMTTGNLARDVTASPKAEPPRIDSPTLITGTIGTSLGYGKAHEEGFHGDVNVRAHVRRKIAIRRNSRGNVTKKSRERFKKLLVGGGENYAFVRAHKMRVDIQAKRYLRNAVRHVEPQLRDYAVRSIAILGRTGRVPTLSDVRGGSGA